MSMYSHETALYVACGGARKFPYSFRAAVTDHCHQQVFSFTPTVSILIRNRQVLSSIHLTAGLLIKDKSDKSFRTNSETDQSHSTRNSQAEKSSARLREVTKLNPKLGIVQLKQKASLKPKRKRKTRPIDFKSSSESFFGFHTKVRLRKKKAQSEREDH